MNGDIWTQVRIERVQPIGPTPHLSYAATAPTGALPGYFQVADLDLSPKTYNPPLQQNRLFVLPVGGHVGQDGRVLLPRPTLAHPAGRVPWMFANQRSAPNWQQEGPSVSYRNLTERVVAQRLVYHALTQAARPMPGSGIYGYLTQWGVAQQLGGGTPAPLGGGLT